MLASVFVCMLSVFVFVGCGQPKVTSIALSKRIKIVYELGDEIDFGDAKLVVKFDNEEEKEVELSMDMISGFDTDTVGDKEMTISYEGKTLTVYYVVNEREWLSLLSNAFDKLLETKEWCVESNVVEGVISWYKEVPGMIIRYGDTFYRNDIGWYRTYVSNDTKTDWSSWTDTEYNYSYYVCAEPYSITFACIPYKASHATDRSALPDYEGKTNAEILDDWCHFNEYIYGLRKYESGYDEDIECSVDVNFENGKFNILIEIKSGDDVIIFEFIINKNGLPEYQHAKYSETEEHEYRFKYADIPTLEDWYIENITPLG